MNSTAVIQWATDLSTISAGLGLRKVGHEYKGPCPQCGGRDRFWMRFGRDLPIIFACRRGCSFYDLVGALEARGFVHARKMPKEEIQKLKLRQPAKLEDAIQAETLLKMIEALCQYALQNECTFEEAQCHFYIHSRFGPRPFFVISEDEAFDLAFEAGAILLKARTCGTVFKGREHVWR